MNSANRKPIIYIALALFLMVWIWASKISFEKIADVRADIKLKSKAIAYQKGLLAQEDAFLSRYATIKKEVAQSKEPGERMNSFLGQLELWAKEENVVIHDVRPMPAEKKENLTQLKVNLELEGDWTHLARFLYKVTASKEPLQIERFSFFQKTKAGTQINLDVELAFLYLG